MVAAICGYIELKKNPKSWINRFFALFYLFLALGFFLYTIYHFIFNYSAIVIPIMVTGHLSFNLGFASLLLSSLMISTSQRTVLRKNYLIPVGMLYLVSIIGYFIWVPTLNLEHYADGIVDTDTPTFWFIFVNLYRVLILLFVIIRFAILRSRATGTLSKQMLHFIIGTTFILIGLFLNVFGGKAPATLGLLLEVSLFLAMDVGMIISLKGFLIHSEIEETVMPEVN